MQDHRNSTSFRTTFEKDIDKEKLRTIGIENGRYQGKFVRRYHKSKRRNLVLRGQPWESLFMRKSKHEKRSIIKEPWHYPMAAQHLASIIIQKHVRGMLVRLNTKKAITKPPKLNCHYQSQLQKYFVLECRNFEDKKRFRVNCISRIQAWWKMLPVFQKYNWYRFSFYHIAAMQIQFLWRESYRCRCMISKRITTTVNGSKVIQHAWRSYCQKKIYRYYRDLIAFRSTGDPMLMLKGINPIEAGMFDAAAGIHVRFRLGGLSFPPTIYYKIFTHQSVCDLNAFSPKDYTKCRRQTTQQKHSNQFMNQKKKRFIRVGNRTYGANQFDLENDGWYKRIEYNGWRSVTSNVLSECMEDPITKASAIKPSTFHYSKHQRRQDIEKKRRDQKRQWMLKMYREGAVKERSKGFQREEKDEMDFDSPNWEEDAEDLLQWSSNVDFEEYLSNWKSMATSGSSMDPRNEVK